EIRVHALEPLDDFGGQGQRDDLRGSPVLRGPATFSGPPRAWRRRRRHGRGFYYCCCGDPAGDATGNSTRTIDPRLSDPAATVIAPMCRRTMVRAMARPRPLPSVRARAAAPR